MTIHRYTYRAALDHLLARIVRRSGLPANSRYTGFIQSDHGPIRYLDSEIGQRCVIFVPDGPNSIEHYADLVETLSASTRVICFDMPGFGFSLPSRTYDHSLASGARAVLQVMDARGVSQATLAFSCANGLYALRVAQLVPDRVSHLVLSQTPSLEAIHRWALRNIPKAIQIPIAGQVLSCLLRRKMAHRWYGYAVPREDHVHALQNRARLAFDGGACFCLAGVVQGLLRESVDALEQVDVRCTLLWGEQDRSHRGTDPLSLLTLVPAAEVIRLPMSGHFPDLEESRVLIDILRS